RGDLFDTLAELAALLGGRAVPQPDPALQALVAELRGAQYVVLVAEPGRWGEQAGLVVEGVNRIVALLNPTQRAAALWLGGGDGAATVNQVFSWLSGLPLRSRAGPQGLAHEPISWDAQRLLASASVDTLLWVASFGPGLLPPAHTQPMVVLGHPGLVLPPRSAPTVFIPVSTPGIGAAGHLVRTDGTVLLPLFAARPDGLPGVAELVTQLTQRLALPQAAAGEVAHG
ncbi:MAG: formylmethanofuran dehydrogenase, partial [Burkholderiales bacterium PBB5]